MMQKRAIILLLSFVVNMSLVARESDEPVEQVKEGNLAVPGTMQPVPFLAFGQNIITKREALFTLYPNWLIGKNSNFAEVTPLILYGLTDDMSIFLSFPIAAHFSDGGHRSSGAEDLIVQWEYAFYSKEWERATNMFTVVAALYLPSGNECKNPATGFGSPSFFLGTTASHLATEWYCFTSYGALLTTKQNGFKAGSQFFYQAGVGKNIAYKSDKWTLMWMVEFYGWYQQKQKINNVVDQNSGFNMIIIGPSLWFSNERFFMQPGISPVVMQHLFGNQSRFSFFAAIEVGVRFG